MSHDINTSQEIHSHDSDNSVMVVIAVIQIHTILVSVHYLRVALKAFQNVQVGSTAHV